MRTMLRAAACALVLLAAGCTEPAPVEVQLEPQFDFMNGPLDLPNVFRFETRYTYAIRDNSSDLVAVAGFPEDPRTRVICGGTDRLQFVSMQHTGELQDVFHMLTLNDDANIHVYHSADIPNNAAFCTAQFIARGVGRFLNTDNDLTYSGTRANTWFNRFQGAVEMMDGSGTRHLNAFQRLIDVNGEFRVLNSVVQLH